MPGDSPASFCPKVGSFCTPHHRELGPPSCAVPTAQDWLRQQFGNPLGTPAPLPGRDRDKACVCVSWGTTATLLGASRKSLLSAPEQHCWSPPNPAHTLQLPQKSRGAGSIADTQLITTIPGHACTLLVTPGCAGTALGAPSLAVGWAVTSPGDGISQGWHLPGVASPRDDISLLFGAKPGTIIAHPGGGLGGGRSAKKRAKKEKQAKSRKPTTLCPAGMAVSPAMSP